MKVIVIGSRGFIGQHLLNHFEGKGFEVWSADVVADNKDNVRHFLIDAFNSDYSDAFQNIKYDICINCSGAANVPDSITDPLRDYNLNTVNVFRILEVIRKYQPSCRFINLSSAAVYGNPKHLPVKEDALPCPLSPYGIHKFQSELICKEFYDLYQIKTCSVRIFSVYGPGLKKQLFWDLYNKAKTGIPFMLFGTGNESRDFIYILDLVKAIDLVSEFSSYNADIINVADGEEVMIKDAASIFFGFFKSEIKYSFSGDQRQGDPLNWLADVKKLKLLGYQPLTDIKTGLQRYYEWASSKNFE